MEKQSGVKKWKELKFIGNTTESHYVDDDTITRLCLPDDVAFNNVTLSVEISLDGNTWFTHCDKYGGVFSIAVGSLRGVVLDLNELEEFENATYN
jgi:hypothetical protein